MWITRTRRKHPLCLNYEICGQDQCHHVPPPVLLLMLTVLQTSQIQEIQTNQRWESVELAMDSSNVSTWCLSQYNIDKEVIRVPTKSLGKSKILYVE